ncbi:MAG TPA: tetratricopeptide repeat protein [Chthonomonadaceae bacterium]|nr:tetratricopeptide repeat protein [Chthonomonadaceae bacterium]
MAELWRIELLGHLCARQGERAVTRFRTHKTGALLAYLAYFRERASSREALVELLWPEDDPDAGRNSLRVAINALRGPLEPPGTPSGAVIRADRLQVQLNPAACTTDVAEFVAALQAEARAEDEAERVRLLTTAVELYRGELLPDYGEAWIEPERQRLADAYLGALRRLVRFLAQARDFDRAIDYARRAVHVDPLREESHRLLMRLYMAAGRPAAALQQYGELERILKEEMGLAPSAAARELAQQLVAREGQAVVSQRPVTAAVPQKAAAAPVAWPTAVSAEAEPPSPARAPGVPLPLTRCFGREEDIGRLLEKLLTPGTRLITLLGPGGAGKTRLALEVAGRLKGAFQGAAWVVPLADLADPGLIPQAILEALRQPRAQNVEPLDQIVALLERQPSLLILDNLEHLLGEDAAEASEAVRFVQALLARVPTLTCLATSRQRLQIAGEEEFAVQPLPVPTHPGTPERLMEFASVQLFVDRAQAVRPDFRVTRANAGAVAELCSRLEGLPLAIELAAAWAQTLTPAQMRDRLARRFDLLVSRSKDTPGRHRTLQAAVEWSYRLLSPPLQRFFACLSVFRGGWTLEAAEAVCCPPQSAGLPPALEYLTQLRERSLILVEEAGEEMRYRVLETLREYAADQLTAEEHEELAQHHAGYFLRLAEEAEPHFTGAEQASWLERLERENENLRAALAWSLQGKQEDARRDKEARAQPPPSELGLQLARLLWRFWYVRGYVREGRMWLERALEQNPNAVSAVRAWALHGAGNLAWNQGDFTAARVFYEQGLELWRRLDHKQGLAATLSNLGNVEHHQGNYARAQALYTESRVLAQSLGDAWRSANAAQNLGNLAADQGEYATAQALYEESCRLFRELGDRQGMANSLSNLGTLVQEQGDPLRARALFEEALAILRELGDRRGIAVCLQNLGNIAIAEGDYVTAARLHAESLTLFHDLGDKQGMAYALRAFATLAGAQGWAEQAACLLGAVEGLREGMGAPLAHNERADFDRDREAARSALDETTFSRAWAQGRAMSFEQAVAYALALSERTRPG